MWICSFYADCAMTVQELKFNEAGTCTAALLAPSPSPTPQLFTMYHTYINPSS
jgi:hypothetical protein